MIKMIKAIGLGVAGSFLFLIISCSTMDQILGWRDSQTSKDKNVAQFFSTMRSHPGNPNSHYLLACYYQERGRHNEAVEEFNKVLLIDPGYIKAYNGMGVSYDLLGNFSKAIEFYKQALEINSGIDYVHNNLGYSYLLQGKFDESITAFKSAIDLNGQNIIFHNNLGLAYGEIKEYDLALTEFKLANDEAEAHYNMAQLYFNKGLFGEAKTHYSIALKLNPSLTVARTALRAADALTKIFEPMPSQAEARKLVIPDKPPVEEKQTEKVAVVHQSPVEKPESVEPILSTQSEPIILKQKELMATEQVGAINSEPLDFKKTDSEKNKILYELQVASFRSKGNAIHVARSIEKLGYKTDILSRGNGNNDRWYRLIVGPFETSDEVLTYKDKIAEKYKFNPLVLKTSKERASSEMISNFRGKDGKRQSSSSNGVEIEISNGNGAYRMAKKVGDYLKEKGLKVTRLTNANHFRHTETRIFYQKEYQETADYAAEQLPVVGNKEQKVKLDRPTIKVKILIGKDLIPHLRTFDNGAKS